MARLWSSGFELNSTTNNVEFNGNAVTLPIIQSSNVRSGLYALEINNLVSATGKGLYYQYLATEVSSNLYYRFYIMILTLPTATNRIFILNDSTALTTPTVILAIDNTGTLTLNDEDGQISGTTTLTTGIWYCIEVHVNTTTSAGSHVIEARIDGASPFASSSTRSISSTNYPFYALYGGNLNSEAQTTGNWFFDDLAINDTTGSNQNSWCGEGKIVHLRPNADGDANTGSRGGTDSGSNFGQVDEITPNDITDYYILGNNGATLDVNIDDASTIPIRSIDSISLVQVGVRYRIPTASLNVDYQVRIKSQASGTVFSTGTLNYTSGSIGFTTNLNNAPKYYTLTSYVDPQAGGAWTAGLLDTAQIGITSVDVANDDIEFTTLWALVEWVNLPTNPLLTVSDCRHTHSVDAVVTEHSITYSYESKATLPTDEAQVAHIFDLTKYEGVASDDDTYTDSSGEDKYNIIVFSKKNTSNTDEISLTWRGKTNTAPTSSTVYLQIYNHNSDAWETIDSDNTTAVDTEFELTGGKTTSLSDYYDADNHITARVYQENY